MKVWYTSTWACNCHQRMLQFTQLCACVWNSKPHSWWRTIIFTSICSYVLSTKMFSIFLLSTIEVSVQSYKHIQMNARMKYLRVHCWPYLLYLQKLIVLCNLPKIIITIMWYGNLTSLTQNFSCVWYIVQTLLFTHLSSFLPFSNSTISTIYARLW